MKKSRIADIKEREPIFFIGKGLVIFSIIVISSLSFALGFLVGNYYHTTDPMETPSSFFHEYSSAESKDLLSGDDDFETQQGSHDDTPGHTTGTHADAKEAAQPYAPSDTTARKPQGSAPDNPRKPGVRTYTVQVGAFRHFADASALKDKFDQKGFMVYVQESFTKNNQKIYKVRVGEFRSRNDAEKMSAKIKKAEGLSTFVTFK